jgi:hypothetical protein
VGVGKSVGLSLTGRWLTGVRSATVYGALAVGLERLEGFVAPTTQRSLLANDVTASFDARDIHRRGAGSSSGEGSPWAEREVLAGSSAGRTSTITTPPEVLASRSGDLRPWSADGTALLVARRPAADPIGRYSGKVNPFVVGNPEVD